MSIQGNSESMLEKTNNKIVSDQEIAKNLTIKLNTFQNVQHVQNVQHSQHSQQNKVNNINYKKCQFLEQECFQKCYKNYNFCNRHITYDKDSPFKQCKFITSRNSRSQQCLNLISKQESQEYCNLHMCTMGLKVKKKNKKSNGKETDAKPISKNVRLSYNNKLEKKNLFKYLNSIFYYISKC